MDEISTGKGGIEQMSADSVCTVHESLAQILTSVVSAAGFSLFDFQPAVGNRGVLRVFVFRKDRESPLPSLDDCSEIARNLLDHPLVEQLMPGESTLEVSTPGVNRQLKTLEHFKGAVGERIRVKWRPAGQNASTAFGVTATSSLSASRPVPASEVDLGVVSEVIAADEIRVDENNVDENNVDENNIDENNTDASQSSPIIVLKREVSSKKGKKQRKKRSSLEDSEMVESDGASGANPESSARSEDAARLTVTIPLVCVVEAHVDFDFK